MDSYYQLYQYMTPHASNENFCLHVHEDYEILMFLEGDAKYVVEENVYDLGPHDMIIIRKNQMHRVYHNSNARYRRIVLNVLPQFFQTWNCAAYEEQFIDPQNHIGSRIDAETVKRSGLYDAFMRLERYSKKFTEPDSPIVLATIIEILYLLNGIKSYAASETDNVHLKEIIQYLNAHFTEDINLDELSKKFFISKYHLCHIFPQATGLTMHRYLTKKRLVHAKDLIRAGINTGEAAERSGFRNYSSFYRAYVKEYGSAPQNEKVPL